MCYQYKQAKPTADIKQWFKAEHVDEQIVPNIFTAFTFPKAPIITNEHPWKIQNFYWGLIPSWAKEDSIKKNTLNARIETIHEKPSFKSYTKQRCLILADAFYEWQWLDEKGKQKQKYAIGFGETLFAFAGLYNQWIDKQTGEIIPTFTILTTTANKLMEEIHNTKKRMPVIVENDFEWLDGAPLKLKNEHLIANKV